MSEFETGFREPVFETEKSEKTDFPVFAIFSSIFLKNPILIERIFSIFLTYYVPTTINNLYSARSKLGFWENCTVFFESQFLESVFLEKSQFFIFLIANNFFTFWLQKISLASKCVFLMFFMIYISKNLLKSFLKLKTTKV